MDKYRAIQSFLESFGIPVYDESSVPSGENAPKFPYITYSLKFPDFLHTARIDISLWYRSSSWIEITKKVEEISRRIGLGGVMISYDNGALHIAKSDAFVQRMSDPQDDLIRRFLLSVSCTCYGED